LKSNRYCLKKAASNFADLIRPSDRIGIIEVDAQVRQVQDSTSDRKKLKASIQRLATAATGGFRIYDGLAQP